MPEFYMLDGTLMERSPRALSPFDRGFMLGDGLFETVLVRGGAAVWLREHYERMKASAAFFDMVFPFKLEVVADWCAKIIAAEAVTDGFCRIALSRGTSLTGRFAELPNDARMAIIAGAAAPRAGMPVINAAAAPWPVNERDPSVRHKTASRIGAVYARARAAEAGVDEFLFCNTQGAAVEGIFSNVFWMKSQELFTPSPECGILPGIARGKVLDAARKLGVKTNVGTYGIDAVREADELFFTNSLMLISRCGAFDGIAKNSSCAMTALERLIFSEL